MKLGLKQAQFNLFIMSMPTPFVRYIEFFFLFYSQGKKIKFIYRVCPGGKRHGGEARRAQSAFAHVAGNVICWSLRSFSNDDGDGDESCKKAIGLDKQNNNFGSSLRFFVHFLAVVARLQRVIAEFHVLSRTGTQDNNFRFLFLNFDTVL